MAFLNCFVLSRKKVLWLCVILNGLLHSAFLDFPPQSIHVWRQCSTLAVARNLYEEGMNPLKPKVDQRFDTNGITGMQFPAYEYLVALGYQMVGVHHFVHRVISFIIFSLGICGIYELFLFCFSNRWAAALGAWSFCWSPELFFFGISALPDVLGLTCSIWGLYFFIRWFRKGNMLVYWASLAATTIGGLAKIQYLAIGFPIAALVLMEKTKYKWNKIFSMFFYAVFSAGLTLAWYFYAVRLIRVSGLTDYDIGFTPAPNLAWAIKVFWHNAVSEIPELILNYATFTFMVIGVYLYFKEKKWTSVWFWPFAIWGISILTYYFIELGKMAAHSYYLLPFLPLLLVFVIRGGLFLKDSKLRWLFFVLLLAQPTLAFFRIVPHRFWSDDKAVPQELYEESSRKELEKAVPNDALCIVGPDDSKTIYFYFLHKKGFGFNQLEDLTAKSANGLKIEEYIQRGAKYLYSDDLNVDQSPILKPFLASKIMQEGHFNVFRLKAWEKNNHQLKTGKQ
jgi:hypothetical protein